VHRRPDTQDSAFQPVIELQAAGMGFAPADSPEQKLAKLEAALARVDMSIADALPFFAHLHSLPVPARYAPALPFAGGGDSMGMSPDAIRRKTMEATCEWLLRMGRQQPVVLLVERSALARPSTLALLDAIIPNLPYPRLTAAHAPTGVRPAVAHRERGVGDHVARPRPLKPAPSAVPPLGAPARLDR
jgi:hypothetical protein